MMHRFTWIHSAKICAHSCVTSKPYMLCEDWLCWNKCCIRIVVMNYMTVSCIVMQLLQMDVQASKSSRSRSKHIHLYAGCCTTLCTKSQFHHLCIHCTHEDSHPLHLCNHAGWIQHKAQALEDIQHRLNTTQCTRGEQVSMMQQTKSSESKLNEKESTPHQCEANLLSLTPGVIRCHESVVCKDIYHTES